MDCYPCGIGAHCVGKLVAGEAALALGEFGEEASSAAPALVELIAGDSSRTVPWREPTFALCGLGSAVKPLVPKLVTILRRPGLNAHARVSILTTFRNLGRHAKAAVPVLRELLEQPPEADDRFGDFSLETACALVSIDLDGNPKAWQRLMAQLDAFQAQIDLNRRANTREDVPEDSVEVIAEQGSGEPDDAPDDVPPGADPSDARDPTDDEPHVTVGISTLEFDQGATAIFETL
jgi:hypothetical protein